MYFYHCNFLCQDKVLLIYLLTYHVYLQCDRLILRVTVKTFKPWCKFLYEHFGCIPRRKVEKVFSPLYYLIVNALDGFNKFISIYIVSTKFYNARCICVRRQIRFEFYFDFNAYLLTLDDCTGFHYNIFIHKNFLCYWALVSSISYNLFKLAISLMNVQSPERFEKRSHKVHIWTVLQTR